MSIRILHLADVHLDRPFSRANPRDGDRDRARVRDTFARALAPARTGEVDAVTIGGDLWEEEHVSPDTRGFVAAELAKCVCPVVLIAGNHDPLIPGGNYERTDWPTNVDVVNRDSPVEHRLSDQVSVWGVSWRGGRLDPSFLRHRVVPEGDDRTHLLLLHGTATPFAEVFEDPGHCPFEPRLVGDAGFSYCLCGHLHRASDHDRVVYPGSPEPLGWGETGDHCVALVEIAHGDIKVELRQVNEHRYEERSVDCSGSEHSGEIEGRIAAQLTDDAPECLHLRLMLEGEVAPECQIDSAALARSTGEVYAELLVLDWTHPRYDLEALAQQPTARGCFVRTMQEQIRSELDDDRRRMLEQAQLAGLRALDRRGNVLDVG